jgi:hyperosmotically inducible periplasmic protein
MKHTRKPHAVLLLSAALGFGLGLLSACANADDKRSAGQKLDEAVAKTEQKSQAMKGDMREAGKEVRDAATNVVDSAAAKARDLAITTQVNAQLTRDASLSAMSINVDTAAGHVLLRGTAPDGPSRDRATALAKAVEGVVQVNNELTLKAAK